MKEEELDEIERTLKTSKPYNELGTYNYFNCESIEKLLKQNTELKEENKELKSVNSFSKRTLYKINKDRLEANQRLLKENQKLKIEISARETVCDELQERINKAVEYIESSALEINTRDYGMLTVCNSDDLLDLLKGDKK